MPEKKSDIRALILVVEDEALVRMMLADVLDDAGACPDNATSIRLLTKTGFCATGRPGPRPNRIEFMLR